MKGYRLTYCAIKPHRSRNSGLLIVPNHDECHLIKPISSLSACAKHTPGNPTENIDTRNVINSVRMQKFPTEECTPGIVVVNHKSVCISRAFDRKVDRNADKLQQTITNLGKQESPLQATGRTATNLHETLLPVQKRRGRYSLLNRKKPGSCSLLVVSCS